MGKLKEKLRRLYLVLRLVKNRAAVLFVLFGLSKNTNAILFNGKSFSLDKKNWVSLLRQLHIYNVYPDATINGDRISFEYMNRTLTLHWFGNDIDTIIEIFCGNPYKQFLNSTHILDKDVIDIGASIADSAIVFLLNGARRVYGYEANPEFVRVAEKNISSNGFGEKCQFENKLVTGLKREAFVDARLDNMHTHAMESMNKEINIPSISLDEIIEKYDVNNAILKMDVEGYEYEIINNTKIENLRRISDMVIEYHYGPAKLIERLKMAGFSISYTTPRKVILEHVTEMKKEPMMVGDLIARRVEI